MYLVFTRMPGESYRRRLRPLLLYLCDVFRALINSLCRFCTSALGLVPFQTKGGGGGGGKRKKKELNSNHCDKQFPGLAHSKKSLSET